MATNNKLHENHFRIKCRDAVLIVWLVTVILTFSFVYRHFFLLINCSIQFYIRMWFSREMATAFQLCRTIRKFFFECTEAQHAISSNKMFCKLAWFELNIHSNNRMELMRKAQLLRIQMWNRNRIPIAKSIDQSQNVVEFNESGVVSDLAP